MRPRPRPIFAAAAKVKRAVQIEFPGAVIVRPAEMFAQDDAFLTTILRLLRSLPAYPMFGDGRARLQPVYVSDVAALIAQILRQNQKSYPIYEKASWSAGLLLRGVVAYYCAHRRITASVDAHAICLLVWNGRYCGDFAAAATHP